MIEKSIFIIPNARIMNETTTKSPRFGKLRCKLSGHRFVLTKKVTDSVSEYRCVHCQEEYTTNSQGKLERLTKKSKEINECLRDLFNRRSKHRVPRITP